MPKMKEISGLLLINKPKGISSYRVVEKIRELTGIKKIGHAGTLDPLASGLLIILVGKRATRKVNRLLKKPKEYLFTIWLGRESSTYDLEGEIKRISIKRYPSLKRIKEVLKDFKGKIKQTPPPFSAVKIRGRKAYELARKKISFSLKPREIEIYFLRVVKYHPPYLFLQAKVSSGTYIRSLAYDLGKRLKTGGLVKNLRRIKIGDYSLKEALSFSKLSSWHKFLKPL